MPRLFNLKPACRCYHSDHFCVIIIAYELKISITWLRASNLYIIVVYRFDKKMRKISAGVLLEDIVIMLAESTR